MFESSAKIGWLEQAVAQLLRRVADDEARIAALEQFKWSAAAGGGGSGGATTYYLACTLGSALAHGTFVTNQTVWQVSNGATTPPTRTNVTATATVCNDGPTSSNDIASGKTVIVLPNSDGTYTAIGVYC